MVSKFEIVAFCQNGILFFAKKTSEWERRDRRGAGVGVKSALKGGGGNSTIQCCFFLSKYGTRRGKYFFSMRCARDRVYRICCFCLKK